MDKFWRSAEQLQAWALPGLKIHAPIPATTAQLLRVHTADYLASVRDASLDARARTKLGLPPSEALLARSAWETGGTIAAAHAALRDGRACNLAGGTHHAFPDRGLGYCVLNDVAVAIRDLQASTPTRRFFVIDTDAHQGNGTHAIFADEPEVFTYSIHVGKNYPAVKTPGDCDVELPRWADGPTYLDALQASLAPLPDRTQPVDCAFWIAGADPHEDDRFGQLRLNDTDFATRDMIVLATLAKLSCPYVVLYGGGYNRDRLHTARIHAETVRRVAAFDASFVLSTRQ